MLLSENLIVANRFRLVKLIGQGGMGSVWQAFDQNLGTDCAIKFIEGEIANLAEAHARFKREAQAAAQLRSPNIVQIFDHNIWEGVPYLAMELLEGEDLAHRLARSGRMSPQEIHAIIAQVCRALGKAHEKGIVHRDLKPDNIFIVRDDDREIAKVLDFGIAKQTSGGLAVSGSNTKTGSLLGTPYYMSPEQAQGTKAVDTRSDLWSLAVIVYQCLTGRLPFESEALGDLLVKIIVSPIPVPSAMEPSISPQVDAWFAKAAARDAADRYQTAKAFSESLSVAFGLTASVEAMRAPLGSGAGNEVPSFQTQHMQSPASSLASSQVAASFADPGAAIARPLSATFSGTDIPAGVPKKGSTGILIAASLGALVLLGGAVFGVMAVKGRHAAATATDPTTSMSMTTKTADPVLSASVSAIAASGTGTASGPAIDSHGQEQSAGVQTNATASSTAAALGASPGGAVAITPKQNVGAQSKPKPVAGTNGAGVGAKPAPSAKPPNKPDLGF